MLLFILLKNNLLRRDRGDVIVFNNTGAEHPATYDFVAECKKYAERRYDVPFFITEYQTYEDVHNHEWTRLPTYRLANLRPHDPDSNPEGYRSNGEPFEEMLSWAGYVPNQFRRICTHSLKLETTRLFLLDWFANQDIIPRRGHWEEHSLVNYDVLYERHCRAGGEVPREIYLQKKEHVLKDCLPYRTEQAYRDFTRISTQNRKLGTNSPTEQEYLSFIGLRADEPARVNRTKSRTQVGREALEHIYMPLADMKIKKPDVLDFWKHQNWDLNLPVEIPLSNCVYCFLKGAQALRNVHSHINGSAAGNKSSTKPLDIDWWMDLDKRYGRDLEAEGRVTADSSRSNYIGFFGVNSKHGYSTVAKHRSDDLGDDESSLPCDCTD